MSGPDLMRLAGLHADAAAMLARGEVPPANEIGVVVRAVLADREHPYWNHRDPQHADAVQIIASLRHFANPDLETIHE